MKTKEVKELTNKTVADLKKMLDDLHMEIANTRLDLKLGKHQKTGQLKEVKRDIARINTVLGQKKGEAV